MPVTYVVDPKRRARLAPFRSLPAGLDHEYFAACDLCGGDLFRTIAHEDRYGTVDHLLSISTVLDNVAAILKPGGYVFIDYVDFETAGRIISDYRQMLKIDHVFYLGESTMRLYLHRHGFEIVAANFADFHPAFLSRYTGRKNMHGLPPSQVREFGRVLRDRIIAPPPPRRPENILTRIYRRAKNIVGK